MFWARTPLLGSSLQTLHLVSREVPSPNPSFLAGLRPEVKSHGVSQWLSRDQNLDSYSASGIRSPFLSKPSLRPQEVLRSHPRPTSSTVLKRHLCVAAFAPISGLSFTLPCSQCWGGRSGIPPGFTEGEAEAQRGGSGPPFLLPLDQLPPA